jgi:hypothetical protein
VQRWDFACDSFYGVARFDAFFRSLISASKMAVPKTA